MAKAPRLRAIEINDGKKGFSHWCPGCYLMHFICTEGPETWSYNGDDKKPTFSPSMIVRSFTWNETNKKLIEIVCHYHITDGCIIYQPDSTHALRAQKTPLPHLPASHGSKKIYIAQKKTVSLEPPKEGTDGILPKEPT